MKKILSFLVLALLLVGCASQPATETTETTETETTETTETTTAGGDIFVYTRDASSGTREAFEKAIGLEELTANAIEVSSNGDMVTKVASDVNGIGYASLSTDFAAGGVTPVNFEGIVPSSETVLDGTYGMQRPFSYVTRASGDFESEDKEAIINAFVDFVVNSTEGMQVVQAAGGEVDLSKSTPWAELKKNHPIVDKDNPGLTIVTAGSTSVEKTLTAALEAFQPMAGNVQFTMNQTGSSDGYKRVLGDEKDSVNAADIGFASREFKTEEDVTTALASGVYCLDAVVAIVNKDNTTITNLTAEDLSGIYGGTITTWDQVGK